MKIELISVIGLLLCLLIIGIEYILLYRLAEIQDENTARVDNIRRRLDIHVEGVLYAPTDSSRDAEITALANEINGDFTVYEMAVEAIREHNGSSFSGDDEAKEKLIKRINAQVDPVSIYAKMLEEGNIYHKGYACRRLAELDAGEYRDKIKEYASDKHRDLAYNAAMALCQMGDVYEVAAYLLSIENDTLYSGRIVNEFFAKFTGDRGELAAVLFEKCNKYMKCTVIKTLARYKLDRFRPMYLEGASGDDSQLKLACIKALAAFGYPEDEQLLQIAAGDKDWVNRSSAIRGLSLLKTQSALDTVKHALGDKEWWVRQTAAQALTRMDISPKDLEEILGGYDRFAADAMKNVLYKTVDA
ncbi:HEAT repeat domain-containing protein [Ruminococcus sp.]|uniref:HEAT repeat domain-containing protein n=1 Tax=Ruminococcus sp. TaxID=41978 RepID=UPI003890F3F6